MSSFRIHVALIILCLVVYPAKSQVVDNITRNKIPNAHQCYVPFLFQMVEAKQQIDEEWIAIRFGGGYAYSIFDPDSGGYPIIRYSKRYLDLPPTLQRFVSFHECGHLALWTTNEFVANCYALQNAGLSRKEFEQVKNFHYLEKNIGPQYGSTGEAFWKETISLCPQFAQ